MTKARKPAAFRLDEDKIDLTPEPMEEPSSKGEIILTAKTPPARRRLRWGAILISSLGSLIALGLGLYATRIVTELFATHSWLGWLGTGLVAAASLAALMLGSREIAGLMRQRRIKSIKTTAISARTKDDSQKAVETERALRDLYEHQPDMAWNLAKLSEHENDILDAAARLDLNERELIKPLDNTARAIIAKAAKRVSIITALSPAALVDIAFVGWQNLRMMRELATLYGGRPSGLSLLRIARMVLAHLALTGGIAIGDDMVQQMLGHGLMAKLSSRLGEGALNGALTARIGLAAMEICRPLPFHAAKRPKIRNMLSEIISTAGKSPVKEK